MRDTRPAGDVRQCESADRGYGRSVRAPAAGILADVTTEEEVPAWLAGGAGSRAAALAMTFKLIESTQQRWRAVYAPHLAALVRSGARFDKGVLVEREQVTVA